MDQIKKDFREAKLSSADRAMLEYVERLTLTPAEMSPAHLERLREEGFNDEAILEIVQIAGYFNYINRLADALGVDPEPEWSARE